MVGSSEAGGELAPGAPASVLAEQVLEWESWVPRGVPWAARGGSCGMRFALECACGALMASAARARSCGGRQTEGLRWAGARYAAGRKQGWGRVGGVSQSQPIYR